MVKSLLFVLMLGASASLSAQKYTTAAGIRIGSGLGLSVQQALWKNYTGEAILQKGFFSKRTTFSALLEQHHPIALKGFDFYLGAGPYIGTYGKSANKDKSGTSVGVAAIGGLEIKLGNTVLSADYVPSLSFGGGNGGFDSQTGISLRYILIKAKKKEHKWMFWKKWGNKDKR